MAEFRSILALESSGLLDKPPLEQLAAASYSTNRVDRFNSENIDFFNLFYNGKSLDIISNIKYIEKFTYFRDVYVFLNRVKNITRVKGDILLR